MAREGAQIRGGLSPLDPLSPLGAKPLKRHVQVRGSFKGTFEPLEGKGLILFVLGPLEHVEPLEGRGGRIVPPSQKTPPRQHSPVTYGGMGHAPTLRSLHVQFETHEHTRKPERRSRRRRGAMTMQSQKGGGLGSSSKRSQAGETGAVFVLFLHNI